MIKRLIKRLMRSFNMGVTDEMRSNYDNGCPVSEKEWLLVECEMFQHGGRPLIFVAMLFLTCVYSVVSGIMFRHDLFTSALYAASAMCTFFGMFIAATTGKIDKPLYYSDRRYDEIMEIS